MPIAKNKSGTRQFTDFRQVALTVIITKCTERFVRNHEMANRMDPPQYANKAKRGVDDNSITSHIDSSGTTVSVLFTDFSSAFSIMQTHVLIKKLLNLEVNPHFILYIRQFICDRPQRVKLNDPLCRDSVLSVETRVNTELARGRILSLILFSMSVNDISCNPSSNMKMPWPRRSS